MELRRSQQGPVFFGPGPLKLITYLPENAIIPLIQIDSTIGYFEGRTPLRFELTEPQISLDLYIAHCGEEFETFMLTNLQDRLWYKLGRGNKMGMKYRIYPTGNIVVIK